ncbi:MAG: DnaJ domain-containing protein [Coriobacteriales bacterium]|jgi:molecular chaperone DnaJ|nr:DnaJ domain-containing protein [Coriobacteriales bacterium]
MRDPYDILGVSHSASPDEIKKAYRKKARENHPDLNPGDKGAEARMNEINQAYDRITNPEKYAASDRRANASGARGGYSSGGAGYGGSSYGGSRSAGYGGYGSSSYGQGQAGGDPFGWTGGFDFDDLFGFGGFSQGYGKPAPPEAAASDSAEVRASISAINHERYQQALDILNAIESTGRNARWYYLSALANNGAKNDIMALEQIRRAVQMEPNNMTYKRVQQQLQQTGTSYREEGQARGFSMSSMGPQILCCGLCVAELLCNAFMMCPRGFL